MCVPGEWVSLGARFSGEYFAGGVVTAVVDFG